MSVATDNLDRAIDRFLAGEWPYLEFWREFMDIYTQSGLSEAEATAYEQAYDAVYMSGGSIVPPVDQALGILTDAQLKDRLRQFRQAFAR